MQLTYTIHKPNDVVFSYLSVMRKFAHVHPVIKKVKIIGQNEYLIYEKLKVGFISRFFTYPASIQADNTTKKITMKAIVMKYVFITVNFAISESDNASIVKEDVLVKTWLPVKAIVKRIFKKQHALLFQNIESETA